jgi:hypothetical protein
MISSEYKKYTPQKRAKIIYTGARHNIRKEQYCCENFKSRKFSKPEIFGSKFLRNVGTNLLPYTL